MLLLWTWTLVMLAVGTNAWHLPVTHDWRHALHLNVPVDAATLQKRLPSGLTADTLNGTAWLTLLAGHIVSTKVFGFPFNLTTLELQVRTPVLDASGVRGLFFEFILMEDDAFVNATNNFFSPIAPFCVWANVSLRQVAGQSFNYSADSLSFQFAVQSAKPPPQSVISFFLERDAVFGVDSDGALLSGDLTGFSAASFGAVTLSNVQNALLPVPLLATHCSLSPLHCIFADTMSFTFHSPQ
jgi:uncharacterized protein YqjF (DUF2071 family)